MAVADDKLFGEAGSRNAMVGDFKSSPSPHIPIAPAEKLFSNVGNPHHSRGRFCPENSIKLFARKTATTGARVRESFSSKKKIKIGRAISTDVYE